MLTNFAVGGTVVPGHCCFVCWEFEDDDALAGGSFEVLVATVQSQGFDFVPGESRGDLAGLDGQRFAVEGLFAREDQVAGHISFRVLVLAAKVTGLPTFRGCGGARVSGCWGDRKPTQALVPPSTVRFAPVMYAASGLATNATNAATSSTVP